jgi:(p)ppGpp synthase/HD superfamily hydrolase
MLGYSDRINHAFAFAAKHYAPRAPAHAPIPFLAHPSNVAVILARHGADETTLVAGILHHVLEAAPDTEREPLVHKVGEKFGAVVRGVACDALCPAIDARGDAVPWRVRKRAVLAGALLMDPRALDIRVADEIHEVGTATALVERLGSEYLGSHGLGSASEVLAWLGDFTSALDRRHDWPGRSLREELAALTARFGVAIGRG